MNPTATERQTPKWWETRVAEFLLTLASLALLAGGIGFLFPVYYNQLYGPAKPKEEAHFYQQVAPHWKPSDIVPKSIFVNRDDGAIYGELKVSAPFKGTRMIPLDKEAIVWRYDVSGKSYAVHIYQPMNAGWVLRSIQSEKEKK